MARLPRLIGIMLLAAAVTACTQGELSSPELGMVASVDPTGLSDMALNMASKAAPPAEARPPWNLGQIAPRLAAVAAGDTSRPDAGAAMDAPIGRMMAQQALGIATTGAKLAMSGGVGLVGAAPGLAMQAVSVGVGTTGLASESTQFKATMARIEAQKAARRIVPDADRPAEARAILSIVDGADGESAAWHNPETGASGKVTIRSQGRAGPSALTCRLVQHEWQGGGRKRTGSMAVCNSGGEWYDLS